MWEIKERPGYLGTNRDKLHSKWNHLFGKENWKISWQWGDNILERNDSLLIYQRGYSEFLKSHKNILNWLLEFKDIFDTAPSNIEAGLSYDIQETINNHIHDIAIRRAVILDLGLKFKKIKGLLHVRPGEEGERLGPHLIPFHLPHMIYKGKIKYKGEDRDFLENPPWWLKMGIKNSVEEFYQQNKLLLTRI